MMIDRNMIISCMRDALEPLPYVHALWLEGADANNAVDEYSDIDFWADIEDACEQEAFDAVEEALASLATIDYKYVMRHGHPQIRQRIYHLAGTGEYLLIDFCWQLHSREIAFVEGDTIEAAHVLFDKSGVIKYRPLNPTDYIHENQVRLEEAKYRRTQHARAMKYVERGLYLEAYAYYNRYVLEPLVDLLRLAYTPAHADYGLVHMSRHIPAAECETLAYFAQISSLADIAKKIPEAANYFNILLDNSQTT